ALSYPLSLHDALPISGVLILDEPTDHLDADARDILLTSLAGFRGVGIVVSHDRTLLNDLTWHTVRVHRGEARLWRGPYDVAKARSEEHTSELQSRGHL